MILPHCVTHAIFIPCSRGFLPYSLFKSLDYTQDKAARGQVLSDWEALVTVSNSIASNVKMFLILLKRAHRLRSISIDEFRAEVEHFGTLFLVQEVLAFIKAHNIAEAAFRDLSMGEGNEDFTRGEKIVLRESAGQVRLAEDALKEFDEKEVQQIKSHYACNIILSSAAAYYERLSEQGLISEREAGEFLEEIETEILHTKECLDDSHAGELSEHHKQAMMPDDDWSQLHIRSSNVKNTTENAEEVKEGTDEV